MKGKTAYYPFLDVVKIVSAVLIVFHHYQQITGAQFKGINFWMPQSYTYWGYLVELFFMVSGYLAGSSEPANEKKSPAISFLHKWFRLWPPAFIATLCYCLLSWTYRFLHHAWWKGSALGLKNAITSLLLIQPGVILSNGVSGANNPIWYLCVLWQCYAAFYLIRWIRQGTDFKINRIWLDITFFAAGLLILIVRVELPFFNTVTARGYTAFFLGAILAKVFSKRYSRILSSCGAIVALAVIAAWYFRIGKMGSDMFFTWLILVLIFYPALLGWGLHHKTIFKVMPDSIINFFAGVSFEMYLWHCPLLLFWDLLFDAMGRTPFYSYGSMILFAVLVEAVSICVYLKVETPLHAFWKRTIFSQEKIKL